MPRIQLKQPAIPILIAFLLGLQLMEPSQAWTILLVTFTGILVSAYAWTWVIGRNIHLRRETRLGWIQVGGQIEERLTLSNASIIPAAWVEFIDHSTMPGFDASRSTSISSGFFDQWNVSAVCRQRGFFSLGDAHIVTGDPFGVFEVTMHASQRTSILVLPQIASLPELRIAPSGIHGEGQPRRNAPQKTMHASTVREYMHGDSTRLIHWPTTARMEKVFVRLMESTPEGQWWIMLDLHETNMLGEGWDSIEEQSVTLAASLADHGLRNRKSVGLACNGQDLAWLAPQKGEGQRWEIMQALAVARPGPLSLASLLEKMHPELGRHSSLIIITASTHIEWTRSLPPLAKRGLVPTILFMDPASFGGEGSAEAAASAMEGRGIQCHVISNGMLHLPQNVSTQSANWTWRATPTGEFIPVKA